MELMERDEHLAQLDRLLDEAARGQGRLALLGGEAGAGKSALIRQFAQAAQGRARTLLGACDPLATPRPLGPLLDIADPLGGDLHRLLRDGAPSDRVFRAFRAELAATHPALVVFEDVHWADAATLDLLRFLGRRLDTLPALLIATYRDDEVGPTHPLRVVFGDLASSPSIARLTLPPLSVAAVGQLAQGSGLDPVELHRRTRGNPFYVTEALASGDSGIPATVRDAVLARVARLSPAGRNVSEIAAVIGARAEPWLLGVVEPSGAGVDDCLAGGMLSTEADALAFRHELARQAVLETLSPHRRMLLHRRVLAALRADARSAADPARLAHHAEAAGDREAVLAYAPAAARQATAAGAHREAAAQYERALRCAGGLDGTSRAELLRMHALECMHIDQLPSAIDALNAAITIWRESGDRLREGEYLARLTIVLIGAGRNQEGEAAIHAALDVLDALPEGPEHCTAFRIMAQLRMLNRDNAQAVAWAERAIMLAERGGDAQNLAAALNAAGSALLCDGDPRGEDSLLRSMDVARAAGDDSAVAAAYTNLGSALGEFYRFREAEHYLDEGIAYCTERDLDRLRAYMAAWAALCHLYQGRWTQAADDAAVVLRNPSVAAPSRIMALLAVGRVRARRGDPEAWAALDEALALATSTATLQRLAPVRAARAEAAWLAGQRERVREEARAVWDLALHHRHPWFAGELAYWRWLAGDIAHGEVPAWVAPPFALQIAGQWEQAADCWRSLDCPYEAARALAESDDEPALRAALVGFERLSARPMAAHAARRLRERGARGIPRGPHPATRAHPAGLTSREVDILRLLATGQRNAEIAARLSLSVRTVEAYVSAILGKLGVRTRTEAAAEAVQLGYLAQET